MTSQREGSFLLALAQIFYRQSGGADWHAAFGFEVEGLAARKTFKAFVVFGDFGFYQFVLPFDFEGNAGDGTERADVAYLPLLVAVLRGAREGNFMRAKQETKHKRDQRRQIEFETQ